MKPKGFIFGIVIAVLLAISYEILTSLKTKPMEGEGYSLTLLDLDFQPQNPPLKTPTISFQAHDATGAKTVTLDSYKGKAIILHFWATWCGPCTMELPHYDKFAKTKEVVNIALSSGGDTPQKVEAFYKQHSIENLPITVDAAGSLSHSLGVRSLPTTLFIDKNGKEIGRIVGIIDWENSKVEKLLLDLLRK